MSDSDERDRAKLTDMLAQVEDFKPLRGLLTYQDQLTKTNVEGIPEIVFTGEVLHGDGFRGTSLGLACNWHFVWDDPWTLLEVMGKQEHIIAIHSLSQGNATGQTQIATSTGYLVPWNHPLDIHFAASSPLGWPKLMLQVQELDEVRYNF